MSQTYRADEIIVVDDGSGDNTSQISKDFPAIRYIYQKNSGVSSARNRGIDATTNAWIAFLDSDDEWHMKKLEEQILFHKENSNVLMSYTDEVWVRDGVLVKIPKKFHKIGKNTFLENISYCNLAPSSVLIHKSIFDDVGCFDESLEVCEDYDLWLRISLKYEIGLVRKKLIVKYAGHENQLSFKYFGMDKFRIVTLQKLLKEDEKLLRKYKSYVKEELLKKYKLLLQGAKKHKRVKDILYYEQKILDF